MKGPSRDYCTDPSTRIPSFIPNWNSSESVCWDFKNCWALGVGRIWWHVRYIVWLMNLNWFGGFYILELDLFKLRVLFSMTAIIFAHVRASKWFHGKWNALVFEKISRSYFCLAIFFPYKMAGKKMTSLYFEKKMYFLSRRIEMGLRVAACGFAQHSWSRQGVGVKTE